MPSRFSSWAEVPQADRVVLWGLAEWYFGRPENVDGTRREMDEPVDPRHQVLAGEFTKYEEATVEHRAIVASRLPVLARARSEQEHERGAVTTAAAALKTSRANVYRMMGRMQDHGPVSGLLPHRRGTVPASQARQGFGRPVDDWIAEAMSAPEASIAYVQEHLRSRAAEAAERGEVVELPGESTLKRRVHHLRGDPDQAAPEPERLEIGAAVLVDYCIVNVLLEDSTSEIAELRPLTALFAIDVASKVVLAYGLSHGEAARGLGRLVSDAGTRLPGLAAEGATVARRLDEVTWVVHPDMDHDRAERAGSSLPASRRPLVRPVLQGEFRGGKRLIGLIGNRFGPFALLPRAISLSEQSPLDFYNMQYFDDRQALAFAFRQEVDRWNRARVRHLPRTVGRGVVAARSAAARLADDLAVLFEPVLSG